MHHVDTAVFLAGISGFLGCYYLALSAMNGVASFYLWKTDRSVTYFRVGRVEVTNVLVWLVVSIFFLLLAPLAFSGSERTMALISLPAFLRDGFDGILGGSKGAVWYTAGICVVLLFMYFLREFFSLPSVAWAMLNASLLLMGLSMTDRSFAVIVTKPDNVPIVGLVFMLGFFTWLGTYKAVQNDRRIARGEPPLEAVDNEKVLVWPDLVYTELICMIAITAVLLLWGIGLQAPLEEPASSVKTPNPSKAPWYFLGLQEMLVYFDPWMAGVVLPSLVIFGLMAIPFLDFNKEGNGYYTISQRKFAYLTFQVGFLVLWVTLIVMGTFLRGPNWNIFGIYETWDPHKVEALNNVDLSEYFWIYVMGQGRPKAPDESGAGVELLYILLRELPGFIVMAVYFAVIPPLLVIYSRFFRRLFLTMGFIRYMVMANLLLMMALLPVKMICRWSFNLKYFISIPEYFLNL